MAGRPRCASACTPLRSSWRAPRGYSEPGTFEFLVDADAPDDVLSFIEANPRLQVEHTVTEAVTGVDLVALQLELAAGRSLAELGYAQASVPAPRGYAIQLRVNTETLRAKDGLALPASGTLTAFEPPAGPGVRTDTAGYAGYAQQPPLRLAAREGDRPLAIAALRGPPAARAARAREFRIEGIATNAGSCSRCCAHPALAEHRVTTRFVEEHAAELVAAAALPQPRLYLGGVSGKPPTRKSRAARKAAKRPRSEAKPSEVWAPQRTEGERSPAGGRRDRSGRSARRARVREVRAGARERGRAARERASGAPRTAGHGCGARATLGNDGELAVAEGDAVRAGQRAARA